MRQVVVLHGWSDVSDSFRPLISFLKANGFDATPLFLGDYVSLRDDVRIDDLASRMEQVVREKMALAAGSRSRLNPTFDLMTHSTGALVARKWISQHYADRPCPVRNLVMLAPANFGSVLAHKGRSMVGRIFKGTKTGFEVGSEVLHGLELASEFQWKLALDDVLVMDGASSTDRFYGPGKVRPYVISGTHPYQGFGRDLINENGSDGTVRVAAANLNARGITIDFSENADQPELRHWRRRGGASLAFPLAVLPDRDHGNVIDPKASGHSKDPAYDARLGELILDALTTGTDSQYKTRVDQWADVSMDTRTFAGSGTDAERHRRDLFGRSTPKPDYFHEHYQLVIRAEDQYGEPISDYFVEFFPKPKGLHRFSRLGRASAYFHGEVLEHVHRNRRDPSRCAFFVDRYDLMRSDGFYSKIPKDRQATLSMTITADDPGPNVSHFAAHGIPSRRGVVDLHGKLKADRWLKRHTTHFIRIIVPRVGDKDLFKLKRV